jgi:hypothetical protein
VRRNVGRLGMGWDGVEREGRCDKGMRARKKEEQRERETESESEREGRRMEHRV